MTDKDDYMQLLGIFQVNPVAALSIIVCMATTLWSTRLVSRLRRPPDRFLVGLVGLISVYQALALLRAHGVLVSQQLRGLEDVATLVVTALYLLAILILQLWSNEYSRKEAQLRLAMANEPMLEVPALTKPDWKVEAISNSRNGGHPDPFWREDDFRRAVIEFAPVAIYAIDLNGFLQYCNPAAELAFGWKRDEVIGQRLDAPVAEEGAVWTAPIKDSSGLIRGTMVVAAKPVATQTSIA